MTGPGTRRDIDVAWVIAAVLLAAVTFALGIVIGRSDPPPPTPATSQLPTL